MNKPQFGDVVLLLDPEGKRIVARLTPKQRIDSHLGYITHEALLESEYGSTLQTQLGQTFVLLRPSTLDLIMNVSRSTQIVYPKEIGYLLLKMNIHPGVRVVEAGTGSGAMTLALARMVQPNGMVFTYEEREEMQLNARKNIERAGLSPYVEFRVRDIRAGFDERDADALFLDVREPWLFLAQAHAALKPGGFFGSLVPTTNQVSEMLAEFERMGNWVEIEVSELLHRKYKTNADRLRPDDRMIAHTGFILTARPVSVQVEPIRTRREKKFFQKSRSAEKTQRVFGDPLGFAEGLNDERDETG
ncbi:MAG TPA: tRNA (adenine-N1)-methyltransferase [Anaerolineae bacterium]|nr:tRNA (adenine-N1)-methyltransferase [Anaerolineae bacterium]